MPSGIITSYLISRYLVRRGFINIYSVHTVSAHPQSLLSDYPNLPGTRQPPTCHICQYGYQHELLSRKQRQRGSKGLPKKVLDSWLTMTDGLVIVCSVYPAGSAPGAMVSF